ncbi:leucine-rich repeat domain-containing protein [Hungatella hathewayi]|uniref:leucine-rich repeat domain-containing protein n=1 Tax=Hungatella hathewayi TaxID=154046 RepID=UPI00356B308E
MNNQKNLYNIIFVIMLCFFHTCVSFAQVPAEIKNTHLSDSGGYVLAGSALEITDFAGKQMTISPSITVDGNSNNYAIEWYRSEDDAVTWDMIFEASGNTPDELAYKFYTDCTQTFSKLKYRLTNEAGTIESGVLSLIIYEKYSIEGNTLSIESTGFINGVNEIDVRMNNYSDPRWSGRTTPWKDKSFSQVIIADHIAAIGEYAFKNQDNLKHVTLSKNGALKTINESAFENSGLLGITIPDSVSSVKKYAFRNCKNLLDIRFLGARTLISDVPGTIPSTKDTTKIDKYNRVKDTFKRQHGFPVIYGYSGGEAEQYTINFNTGTQVDENNKDIEYCFIPINDSEGHLIEWNYEINGDTVKNLYTSTTINGEVSIPKSIDGYLVTEIGNIVDRDGHYLNLFGLVISDEDDSENVDTAKIKKITTVRIPDSVKNIGQHAITDCPSLSVIYCDYYGEQTTLALDGSSSERLSIYNNGTEADAENATIYLYSRNHNFEALMPNKYARVFYDKVLSGVTKNTDWTLDMKTKTLTVSKHNGSSYTDEPFDWAYLYIEKIMIAEEMERIEDRLFDHLYYVKSIYNNSLSIEYVGADSFKDVGSKVTEVKTCTTYVDNKLYDAISNEQHGNPFNMIFMETKKSCGPNTVGTIPTMFYYDPIEGLLKLSSKDGTPSVMKAYNADEIPWRCVKTHISKVEISSMVSRLSANTFTDLPNLREVYNKATNQTTIGNGELFNVIDRYDLQGTISGAIEIMVSDPINYSDLWSQLSAAGFKSFTIEELKKKSIVPGKHVIYPHMIPSEVLDSLEVNTKYIVPVYCYLDENSNFVDKVPQPETKGYRLESIYLDYGTCGDDLKWYLYRDGNFEIVGTGSMYNFNEKDNRAPWYKYKDKIYSINLSSKMTNVGSFAFDGLSKIDHIDIPDSVTIIGLGAFQNSSITSFTLPYNVTQIEGAIFTGCDNLRYIKGSDANFKVVDGNLYNRDQSILIEYLRTKIINPSTGQAYESINELTIPTMVNEIADRAFYKDNTLNKLYILSSVKKIGSESLAEMEKLYYIDCKTGENDPPYLDSEINKVSVQSVPENALNRSASVYPSREVLIYKANTDLVKAAAAAGYKIRFYDSLNIHHINANYSGAGVVIGQTIPLKGVNFDIVYASGLSESTTGEDIRFSINNNMTIKKVGDNIFSATYNDGYTDPIQTGEFVVEGINRITNMSVKYNGLDIWYGESFAPSNVMISLQYANGDIKTISGESEYVTFSDKIIDTLEKNSHYGKKTIQITYNDKQNKVFVDSFKVNCNDYIETISSVYNGSESIEATAGINGLTDSIKDDILIDIKWRSSANIDQITGNDGSVSYSGGGSVVNNKLQIEVGYNKNNRYDKTAVVNIPCASNVRDVMFSYIGSSVTKGTSVNLSNIMITVYYTDGTQQNFKADTVENITVEPMIINNYGVNNLKVTYSPPGYTKTDNVVVMGTIALPVKLIVAERPKKTVYQAGEVFERDGLRVNCLYDNGEIQDVSDLVEIENGTNLSKDTKNIVISYTENRDGQEHIVKTYMSININENQKELLREKTFRETYEIDRILFRSKKTEDTTLPNEDGEDGTEEEEDNGKWVELELNNNSKGENTDLSASIKAGYGFELKVYTKYKTTRGSQEFKEFMNKTQWNAKYDEQYASVSEYIDHKDDWDYLDDIYPQHVPTANPDIMYVRIIKRSADDEDKYTLINGKDFIVMDKTNKDEKNRLISEGEWYNSQKIFEFPLRTVDENGEIINTTDENGGDRRVYVSRDAAQSDSVNTEYVIQVLSPAWYGYESETKFDDIANQFLLNDDVEGTGIRKNWYNGDMYKYLHVAYEFSLFVQKNDDIHTHILQ